MRIDGTKSFYYTGEICTTLRYADALLMLAECMNGNRKYVKVLLRGEYDCSLSCFRWNGSGSICLGLGICRRIPARKYSMSVCVNSLARVGGVWTANETGHFEGEYIQSEKALAGFGSDCGTQHRLFPVPMVEIKQNLPAFAK